MVGDGYAVGVAAEILEHVFRTTEGTLRVAWFFLPRFGKDVLVVSNGKADAEPWLSQIRPAVKERALFLNYEEHQNWQRWSLPVLLFHAFGPSAKPASFMKYRLPAVLLMRRFRLPMQFQFSGTCP